MSEGFVNPLMGPCVKSLFKAMELLNARMNRSTSSLKYSSLQPFIDAVLTGFSCVVNMSKVIPGNNYDTIAGECAVQCVHVVYDVLTVALKSLEHFINTLQTIRSLYESSESMDHSIVEVRAQ